MAAISFTSPSTTLPGSSSLLRLCNLPSQNAPTVAAYYPITKSSILFPSVSSILHIPKSKIDNARRRRHLGFVVSSVKNLSETDSVAIPPETHAIPGMLPSSSGVYAVYDGNEDLQFVGITKNIAASVASHRRSVPQLCSSVKIGVVDEPDRAALTQAWKAWMEEHISATGKVPPGNEPGNTTWVRQPPKRKSDLRLTPGRHAKLTIPLEDLIDRLVKENNVVAFIKGSRSAPQCGFSQRVVAILESQGVDYESVDVLDEEYNSGLRETLKRYSNWPTFPQIFVNGELVGGCDILSSMYEKGELADLFKK